MKYLKFRDVKSPERWTKVSSWIDFFAPNNFLDVKDEIIFTPKNTLNQERLRDECIEHDAIRIDPWNWVLIPSWLKVILPKWDKNSTYEMVLYNKSWVAVKQNLLVGAQVIDNDYRWEFNIHLINTGESSTFIEAWQKVSQWIVRKVELVNLYEINEKEFAENADTERWDWWFGSTWKF